jgi:DNA sulfur modification protein DndB
VFVKVDDNTGSNSELGVLKLKLGDELIINDGQHRCAGIAAALTANPALAEQTISVLLFPWESKDRVQQMFSDLNRFVQKTSKSLDILYDKRDSVSAATLASIEEVPVLRELTDKDSVSLRTKSPKLFTLAALYDANRELLKGRDAFSILENAGLLKAYWTEVAKHMPDWGSVLSHHKDAPELRAEKISSHSTVLRALGGLGHELMKDPNWPIRLEGLESIDWSKKNKDWEDVCIVANSVISNRQARAATKAYIKAKLSMDLTEAEQRVLGKSPAKFTAEDL